MTGTELAVRTTTTTVAASGALAVRGDQTDWTPEQQAALAQIGIADAPRGDQLVLLHMSQQLGLNPWSHEIYMIGRWDQSAGKKKWTIQIGIDGFRSKSEEHPQYAGVGDAEWCGEDGVWKDVWLSDQPPAAARFTVFRKDWDRPTRAVAHYREYVQYQKDGKTPTSMWSGKPAGQLAKCAEALARRRAFPRVLTGVFAPEELEHLDNPQPRPMIIDAAPDKPAEPNWDVLISSAVNSKDLGEMKKVWNLARGLHPNDAALLDRIAQAGERMKAPAEPPAVNACVVDETVGGADAPAEKTQRNRLFALLRDGAVSGSDRALRLRIVTRLLNRAHNPVTSFDELTVAEVDTINDFLQRHKDQGDLTHTLAELGAADTTTPTEDAPVPDAQMEEK